MHRALECSILHSLLSVLVFVLAVVANSSVAAAPFNSRQLNPPPPIGGAPLSPSLPDSSQQSFSDGGGSDFNVPAILWIVFCGLVGLPLATAGVRGWRITSGIGLGLLLSFFIWCAFVNTTTGASLAANPVTSDLFLSLFVWGCFLLGVGFGVLRIGILAGVSALGASGGVALGILLALLRPGLLVPIYAINIVPIGILGAAGAAWPMWHQRLAVIVSSSACGCFFVGLATDLVLNKQSGISQGIRFLLDRNDVHITATLKAGYQPSLSTWIIVGASIGLIPVFSYLQHRIFRQPFDRTPESLEAYQRAVNGSPVLGPGDEGYVAADNAKGEKFAIAPQHVRMRFPSIIPSLPGQVDPRYTAQQQAMRAQKEQMEAKQNGSTRPIPAPGIGRMNFITPAVSAVTTAARRVSRMSTHFVQGWGGLRAGGADRRASAMSVPSVYSVATMDRGAGGARQQQQPSSRLQYDNSGAYDEMYGTSGTQLSPIRPLQLPNRQQYPAGGGNGASRTAAPPPSSYVPPTRSGISNGNTRDVASQPPVSLRNNRNGWGANGLPRSPARRTEQQQQQQANYYGSSPTTPTPRSAGSSKTGNRLKPTTRYNLL